MSYFRTAQFGQASHDALDMFASILIVSDDEARLTSLRASLQLERYAVTVACDSSEALDQVADRPFELLVLNLSLSAASGIELLREIRAIGCTALVLVLSPRSEEVDKVQAFRLGADDYVVTPVGSLELIARIGALLRRTSARMLDTTQPHNTIQFGQVVVNRATHSVTRAGSLVTLTPREFDLLTYLLDANGRIVSRTTIMRHVWRYAMNAASRTIDQHIARLRFKLELDPLHPVHVLTVRKAGYRLNRATEVESMPPHRPGMNTAAFSSMQSVAS